MGVEVLVGDPRDEVCGTNIILPEKPEMIKAVDLDMNRLRKRYIRNAVLQDYEMSDEDLKFLAEDTKTDIAFVKEAIDELRRN